MTLQARVNGFLLEPCLYMEVGLMLCRCLKKIYLYIHCMLGITSFAWVKSLARKRSLRKNARQSSVGTTGEQEGSVQGVGVQLVTTTSRKLVFSVYYHWQEINSMYKLREHGRGFPRGDFRWDGAWLTPWLLLSDTRHNQAVIRLLTQCCKIKIVYWRKAES